MSSLLRYCAFLIVSVLLFAGFGCTQKKLDDGKIPITTSSEEARGLFLQARDLQDKFLYHESRGVLEQAVVLDPDFALAYRDLAFAQSNAKHFFEYFNKACALTDKASEGERLWILGDKAGKNDDPIKQKECFLQLVKKYPKDERAHHVLAKYYFDQQEYDEAIAEFRKAIEIAPDFSPPYNLLGYANRGIENYPEAEKAFQKYIDLNPNDPNPYDSYAELLLKMGRFEESIQSYRKALAIKHDFTPSHMGITANWVYQGKHKEARSQLQEFLKIAKNDGQRRAAYFNKAVSYIDEGKFEEALTALNERYALAERISDTVAMARDIADIACILFEQGLYDDALSKYKTSIKLFLDSDLSDEIKRNAQRNFLYNESRIAMKKGDFDMAKAKCDSFFEQVMVAENSAQIRLSHELAGMIALEERDYDRALDEFQQGDQKHPYNLYRIALAYDGKGDHQKAEEFYTKAARFYPLLDHLVLNINYAFARPKAEKMLGGK